MKVVKITLIKALLKTIFLFLFQAFLAKKKKKLLFLFVCPLKTNIVQV